MTMYYPLEKLRKIPGLEYAKYVDPYAGSKGNSIRYLSVAPRTNDMKVIGVDNLFCAGEKAGLFVGHTEAICTGSLAGHNAARYCANRYLIQLPTNLLIGDFIAYSNNEMSKPDGDKLRFTFAGSIYFNRMKELGFYSIDSNVALQRLNTLIESGLPGGKARIEETINTVKKQYPTYLKNPF